MDVLFYQVFVMKNEQTQIRLADVYKIRPDIKTKESSCEGFYILSLDSRKKRRAARRYLILSHEQYEQLIEARKRGEKKATINNLYSKIELYRILKHWNPRCVRLYQAAQFRRVFHRIRNYVMSNLFGDFVGKFLLPTPPEETFDIPRMVQACIDGRK